MTLNDPDWVSRSQYFRRRILSKPIPFFCCPTADNLFTSFNLQCNVPLTRCPTAIAEPLVNHIIKLDSYLVWHVKLFEMLFEFFMNWFYCAAEMSALIPKTP